MTYQMKDNTGTLFKNGRKEKETHADYQGEAMVDGVVYWFNAWIRSGKGGKFMSCSFRPKQDTAPAPRSRKTEDVDDDTIPF